MGDPTELLGAAVERMAARLGEVALPEMLREIATLVERHAIKTAARHHGSDAALASALGITGANLNRRRRRLADHASAADEESGSPSTP